MWAADVGDGVVEVDETFVGGVSIGRSGASTTKATVMVAVEKPGPGRKLGRIRLGLADRPNTLGLVAFATNSVVPGSTIHIDGARMMRRLSELGYTHEYATGYTAPDPAAVLPGVHLTASLLKRWLTGTLRYGVAEHQRPYYLDEFAFRFNRRNATSRGLLVLPTPPTGRAHRLAPARGPARSRLQPVPRVVLTASRQC